jgi:hypothetical protein
MQYFHVSGGIGTQDPRVEAEENVDGSGEGVFVSATLLGKL